MTTYNSYFGTVRTGSKSGPGIALALIPHSTPFLHGGSGGPVTPAPVGAVLQKGTKGTAYSETISAVGGTSPYTYAVTSGSLPTSTSLNSSTGVISGTPSATGTFSFTVTVTDSLGNTGSQSFSIAINAPQAPVPVAEVLLGGTVGISYSELISAVDGTGPYTFAVTSGALPGGLSLASGGTISGTPTTAGTFTFTVTATDANGTTGSTTFQIIIASPSSGATNYGYAA